MAIRRILRVLAREALTLSQAIGTLAELAERSTNSEQEALYRQTIVALRQLLPDQT